MGWSLRKMLHRHDFQPILDGFGDSLTEWIHHYKCECGATHTIYQNKPEWMIQVDYQEEVRKGRR